MVRSGPTKNRWKSIPLTGEFAGRRPRFRVNSAVVDQLDALFGPEVAAELRQQLGEKGQELAAAAVTKGLAAGLHVQEEITALVGPKAASMLARVAAHHAQRFIADEPDLKALVGWLLK